MPLTRSAAKRIERSVLHKSASAPGLDGVPPLAKRRGGYLNLDVLLLIARHAHPRDLLNLARTCKYFRGLLTDKTSDVVWKTIRDEYDVMPECPADLTEREYTDLAFSARCHGCGGYADSVLWEMRRRYCPDCRAGRLVCLSSCDEIVQKRYVLAIEHLTIDQGTPMWVDREQMESFLNDYTRSSDKPQLLRDRQEKLAPIRKHARQCEKWQRKADSKLNIEQDALQKKREKSIFARLKRLGYRPEIKWFGHTAIRDSRKPLFNTSKQLTDKEWDRIWPEWLEKMNDFRLQRLEKSVFRSRRETLASEYETYVTDPAQNTPSFELLPHVADIARFPPFRDIIRAPEETQTDAELFGPAFAQLPELVADWRKKLDLEAAELVQIPSDLSLEGTSSQVAASSSTTAPTDKLRLACARFKDKDKDPKVSTYPEILSISMRNYYYPDGKGDSERTGSISERFGITFIREAPSVIRACGLDPHVATAADMDRRNAQFKCLGCRQSEHHSWIEAISHAATSPHVTEWELVPGKPYSRSYTYGQKTWDRCLLCRAHVGDGKEHNDAILHLKRGHKIEAMDAKRGVHYMPVAIGFTIPSYPSSWGWGF